MPRKQLKRIVRYRDKALKHFKLLREKFDEEYFQYYEIRDGRVLKLPPQFNPHK